MPNEEAKYETEWLEKVDFQKHSEAAQRLLVLLTHKKYKWRTAKMLSEKSHMSEHEVAETLDGLRKQEVVTISLSKKNNVIYGLRRRVRQGSPW